jgi:hypothetical protein
MPPMQGLLLKMLIEIEVHYDFEMICFCKGQEKCKNALSLGCDINVKETQSGPKL